MKKGMANVLILALVLINLILTVVIVFTFVPSVKKTNNLIDKISSIIDLNIEDGSSSGDNSNVSLSDIDAVTVMFGEQTETTISLTTDSDGKVHYARIGVVLSLNKKASDYNEVKQSIESAMSLVGTTITDVISKYKYSTVDKDAMLKDILYALQNLIGSDCLYSVSFNPYLIQ